MALGDESNPLPPRQTKSRSDAQRAADKQAAKDKRIYDREEKRQKEGKDSQFRRSRAEQKAVDEAIERERQRMKETANAPLPEMEGKGGTKVTGDRVVRGGGDGDAKEYRAESFDCWRNGTLVVRRLLVE